MLSRGGLCDTKDIGVYSLGQTMYILTFVVILLVDLCAYFMNNIRYQIKKKINFIEKVLNEFLFYISAYFSYSSSYIPIRTIVVHTTYINLNALEVKPSFETPFELRFNEYLIFSGTIYTFNFYCFWKLHLLWLSSF